MQNGGALSDFGMILLTFIATMILIGIAVRMSSWSIHFGGHRSVSLDELRTFLFRLLFCCVVEHYWVTNIPGVSFGFNRMFSYIAAAIAQILDQSQLNQLNALLANAAHNTPVPTVFAPMETICYWFVQGFLGLASGILFLINCSAFSQALPVFIEKELTNPSLVNQYVPGDIIQYRQGSPASQGIPNDSVAVVVATDIRNNQLTVKTSHGDEVIYSPHLTKAITAQSRVYREEQQEFAQGDRVRMTEPNAPQGIRKGDFGTITSIGDTLEVRLDKGETVQLTRERAKHIEHGYAVDSLKTGAPHRVLINQDGSFQATSEAAYFSRTGREVSIYTSDRSAQANTAAPAIALPDRLKPAIAHPVQQQSEGSSKAIAPEQAPVIQHRHSRGR